MKSAPPVRPTSSSSSSSTVTAPRRGRRFPRFPGGRVGILIGGIVLIGIVVALVIALLPGGSDKAADKPGPGDPVPLNTRVPQSLSPDGEIEDGAVFGGYTGEVSIPNPAAVTGAVDSNEAALQAKLHQTCSDPQKSVTRDDCVLGITLDSLQAFWGKTLHRTGAPYLHSPTVFYSDPADASCANSGSATGSFYCSDNGRTYVNIAQWKAAKKLSDKDSGTLGQQYLIAHTYAHHVQDIIGIYAPFADASDTSDANVRVELEATCYAGIWMNYAGTLKGPDGNGLVETLDDADIAAVTKVGESLGNDWVEGFHGTKAPKASSVKSPTTAQLTTWFSTGYHTSDVAACDTFRDGVDLG